MCGIAGAIGRHAAEDRVRRMTDAIAHRGPDGEGVQVPFPGAALGHRRLSIIDLSVAGAQPMSSADGRFTVVFNGEIYNYTELRAELGSYPYRSQTDTEVLIAAWARWGDACLEKFRGMFAFAIADRDAGTVTLVRDRFGIKPLFWAEREGTLYFASEIKALLAAGVPAAPDHATIATYLLDGYYDHRPETFYAGIRMLPPGTLLSVRDGQATQRRWWDLPAAAAAEPRLPDGQVVERYRALLDDSIRLHLRSDVPIGVNLSSGVDSVSLFSLLKRTGAFHSISAFSMGFADPAFDETRDIAALASGEGIRFARIEIQPQDHVDYLERTLASQDQPFGGLSTVAYMKLMERTRADKVTVLLEGQGVDETLGGYSYFFGPLYADWIRRGDVRRVQAEIRRLASVPGGSFLGGIRAYAAALSARRSRRFQDGSVYLRPGVLRADWVARMRHELPPPAFSRPFRGELANALYRDTTATKLPRVLRFNDHASMAYGRELRVPYLDHPLVTFAFSLADGWKIEHGVTKVLLREAMRGIAPEELRARQKRPQSSPQTVWYKGALRTWVLGELSGDAVKALPMIDQEALVSAFRRFVDDPKDNNSFFFWQVINLARWSARLA